MKRIFFQFSSAVVLLLIANGTALGQASVSAQLDPEEIDAGGVTQLALTVSGVTSAQVSVPTVNGLTIVYAGQQSSFTMINGQTNRQLTIYYHVRAEKPGEYEIPPVWIDENGQHVSSEPVHLHVGGSMPPSNLVPSAIPSQQYATPPAAGPSAPDTAEESSAEGDPIFVRVLTSKKTVYVGEVVPVQIKLYVRSDSPAKLRSLPSLDGDAFTLSKLAREPKQAMENVGQMPYQTATWDTSLSAIKPGDYPVIAHIDLTVLERQRSRHGGIFDDPFFALLSTSMKQVDKTFSNPEETWKALPLPTEGRPASFNGAIGDFRVTAQAQPAQVAVGDPLTLQYSIEGRGNFDRITAPTLSNVDGWRTYPASGKTELSDDYSFTGKKVFEQAIIPQKTGVSMPKVVFSWFNPETRQYVTREATPNQVAIAEAPPGSAVSSYRPATPSKSGEDESKKEADALTPNKVEIGSLTAGLQPQILNPWIVLSQALTLSALVVCFFSVRRRRLLESNPVYAQALKLDRHQRETLGALHEAASNHDAAAFFNLARLAMQLRLGAKWKIKPESITYHLIEERQPALAKSLQMIFHLADELSYSGHAKVDLDLADWERRVKLELDNLEHTT